MLIDLLISTVEARSQQNKVSKILRENYFPSRILCSAKLSIKFEDRTKTFLNLQGLKILLSVDPFLGRNQNKYSAK